MGKEIRDTQFLGFASRVVEKLNEYSYICDSYGQVPSDDEGDVQKQVTLILAQAAYDLACHTLEKSDHSLLKDEGVEAAVRALPDLVQWPKEET